MNFRRYTWTILAGILMPIALVLALNLLRTNKYRAHDRFLQASEWQEKTHGMTMAVLPGYKGQYRSGPFKVLRLNDRLLAINAMVFGASTAMGIQEDMFPPPIRIYNFAHHANLQTEVMGEIKYALDHFEHVRWMFVPLEWAMGFLFLPGDPKTADLSRAGALHDIETKDTHPIGASLKEALSYPQIRALFTILYSALTSNDTRERLYRAFFQSYNDEYLCPNGVTRDYEPYPWRGCVGLQAGFQYDGSMDFGRSGNADIQHELVRLSAFLPPTRGQPREELLDQLAVYANRLEQRGGQMIFFLPPVLPRLQSTILKQPGVGPYLMRAINIVKQWAEINKLELLDFGPSEDFGCTADEFVDGAHATPPCYRKAFTKIQQTRPGLFRLPSRIKQAF
jgi:hypothetical protein